MSQYVCRQFHVWGAAGRRSVASRPGGWETSSSLGIEPISPHSVYIRLLLLLLLLLLPFEVPRFLFELRGWPTTSSLGIQVIGPSTQHIPTTVTSYGNPPVCMSGRVASGFSAVWPSGISAVWPWLSGRMASGLSPYGVASFVHAGGGRHYQVPGDQSNPSYSSSAPMSKIELSMDHWRNHY